jgi:hypothetical protein
MGVQMAAINQASLPYRRDYSIDDGYSARRYRLSTFAEDVTVAAAGHAEATAHRSAAARYVVA